MLKKLILATLIFPFSLIANATERSLSPGSVILIGTGEQKLLYFDDLNKYSFGEPILKAVRPPRNIAGQNAILVKGVRPGETDLWVWKRDGSMEKRLIRVVKMHSTRLPHSLLQGVSQLQEVEVFFAGPGIVLHGNLRTLDEAKRVALLTANYPQKIRNDTAPSIELLEEGREWFNQWIEGFSKELVGELAVEVIPPHLFVDVSVGDPKIREKIEEKIKFNLPFAFLRIESPNDTAKTIYLRIHLIELQRSKFGSFGLDWPSSTEQALVVSSQKIQNLAKFDLTLNLLEADGSARLLSSPEIVMRSPGKSELFAGGEIPITQKGRFSSRITWKPHGLRLNLESKESTKQKVQIAISTEFSHLNYQNAVDQVPSIQVNRVLTEVNAVFNEPLFLCGLLHSKSREVARGIPLLRSIPVLGKLFGSEEYLNEKSELVLVIIPFNRKPKINPIELETYFPSGPMPALREWIQPDQLAIIQSHPDFPWNVLQ